MQKDGVRKRGRDQTPERRASILLSILCPLRSFVRCRKYEIHRETKCLFYQGGWRSLSGVQSRRGQSRSRWQAFRKLPKKHPKRIAAVKRKRAYDSRPNVAAERARRSKEKRRLWSQAERRAETKRRTVIRNRRLAHSRKVWKDWYDRNRECYCIAEIARRDRRDASRVIRRACEEFRAGNISYDELDRRIVLSLTGLHENAGEETRPRSTT